MPGKLGGPITPISPISPTTPTSRTRRLLFLSAVFIIPTLLTLAAYQLFGPGRARASWYYDGETEWAYRQTITINNSQVAGSSSHTNFPVMIRLDNHTDLQTYAQSTGADILFTDSNNSKLDHEIESYDSATGSLVAWVRIPSLSPSSDTTIYMYYGSPGSSDQQNLTGVWDSDFVLVQHLQETTTGDTDFLDSTSNAHDSSEAQFDAAGSSADATGIANGAVIFDDSASAGDNDYITIPDHDDLTPADDITVEVWLNLDKLPSTQAERPDVIFKANTGPPYSAYYIDFDITGDDADHPRFFWRNSSSTSFEVYGPDAFSTGSWYYIAGTRTGDSLKIHVNGSATSAASPPGASDTLLNSTSTLYIGSIGGFNPTAGSIDEIRISSTARSDDWITTTYNTINNPDDFITLGDQEQQPNSDTTDPRLPVAYWKFDEGQGLTANDSTTNANHGTITGATWATEDMCISGKCLSFDGTNDLVSANILYSPLTSFSLSFWYRPTNLTTSDILASQWNGSTQNAYMVRTNAANADELDIYIASDLTDAGSNYATTTDLNLTANQWTHISIIYDGSLSAASRVRVYANGNLKTTSVTGTIPTSLPNSSASTTIGGNGTMGQWSNGYFDDYKIYPYARTAEEVRSDYLRGAGKAGSSAVLGATDTAFLNQGLVGYWKMDELSGTTVADASGNGNHGTLTNAQESGTSDASGNSTTTLVDTTSELLSETDDAYNGMILRFTAACGDIASGTERLITDYTGTTKTLTVGTALAAAPDSCAYEIRHQVGGKFGSGVAFDGESNYISVSSSSDYDFSNTQSFTVNAWAKLHGSPGTQQIIHNGRGTQRTGYEVGIINGKWRFMASDTYDLSSDHVLDYTTASPSQATWYMVTWVIDRNTHLATAYVDGDTIGTIDINSVTGTLGYSNLNIGRDANGLASRYWSGTIDEVRLYNRALSASEVAALYAWAPGPLAHWKMDEGEGSTISDIGGTNNYGTLGSADETPTWVVGKYGKGLKFDGTNDRTTITTNPIAGMQHFSMTAWVYKPSADVNDQAISGSNTGGPHWRFNFNNSRIYIWFYNSSCSNTDDSNMYTSQFPSVVGWHHYAFTMDTSGIYKVYQDGILYGTKTYNTWDFACPNSLHWIRFGNYYTSYTLNGTIDDYKVYNYARTQEQILEDMYGGRPIATVEAPLPKVTQSLGGSTEADDLSDGAGDPPIAEWKFDEKTGTTASDSSGNGFNLTLQGSMPWTLGRFGSGLRTINNNTNREYANISDQNALDFSNSEDYTLSAWIKMGDTENSYYRFITKDGTSPTRGYYMWANSLSEVKCTYRYDATLDTATASVPDSNWHHVVCLMDRNGDATGTSGLHIFIDSVLKASDTSLTAGDASNDGEFYLGEHSASYEFDSSIDEVKIYDYARTPAQIAYDYNRGAPIAHYKMDECQGTTIYDTSGNANHGTLSLGESGVTSAGTCQTESTAWGNGASGKYSSAMSFDDSDDYIQLTNPLTFDTITYSAWVKITSNQSGTIASQGVSSYTSPPHGGIALSAGVPRMYSGYFDSQYRYAQATTNVNNGSWNHIVGVSDDNGTYIYVNGVLEGQDNTYKVSDSTANPTYFGIGAQIRSTDRQNLFGGLIDDVRIYNYALSATQIKKLYNANSAIRFGP